MAGLRDTSTTDFNLNSFNPANVFTGFGAGIGADRSLFGFGSQPTPTNQGGNFFSNLFGGDNQNFTTGLLGGLNAGIAGQAAFNTAEAAKAAAAGQLSFLDNARIEGIKSQLSNNQLNLDAQFGFGADLAFDRENRADLLTRFRNRQGQLASLEIANSPEARRAKQFENQLAIKKELGSRIGSMRAMFGGGGGPISLNNLVI